MCGALVFWGQKGLYGGPPAPPQDNRNKRLAMGIRLIPDDTKFDFTGNRFYAFAIDGVLALLAIVSLSVYGLNLGIDFTGGVSLEVSKAQAIDVADVRQKLEKLDFGEVIIQGVDNDKGALIRVQPKPGTVDLQKEVVEKIRTTLGDGYKYSSLQVVGPKVSGELFISGIIANVLAVLMIAVYVAFRFEWQFGVSAVLATGHDVLMGAGLFSVFQLDFNLTSVAALLLLAGYSINDTVVIFDRIREYRRKYKKISMDELINTSINTTLSRTVLTSLATTVSVLPLLFFGGDILFGFAACILWGIVIGTYSSIFVAAALLLYMPPITVGLSEADKANIPAAT
jgi:preprotein translocase subunit SecF